MIEQALIFAAGLGTRMQPLTLRQPKPLLTIHGKPLLYSALELALTYPLKRIFINAHYFADQIQVAIDSFINNHTKLPKILVITESDLLDTGGTLKSLNRYFTQGEAIFTINSDCLIEPQADLLQHMNTTWDSHLMDFLMLVHPVEQVFGSASRDFTLRADGTLSRNGNRDYMYTGLQVISANLAANYAQEKFSLGIFNQDSGYEARRYGIVNTGQFCHASIPQDLQIIENCSALR